MNNLNELLALNYCAKQYFMTLPEDAQGALIQNTQSIHTEEELHRMAQSVLQSKAK